MTGPLSETPEPQPGAPIPPRSRAKVELTPEREDAIRAAVKLAADDALLDGKSLADIPHALMLIADKLQAAGLPATHSGEIVVMAIKSILADAKA